MLEILHVGDILPIGALRFEDPAREGGSVRGSGTAGDGGRRCGAISCSNELRRRKRGGDVQMIRTAGHQAKRRAHAGTIYINISF